MKSLVIGASGGLGRAIAEQLAEIGHDLVLVGTDDQDLTPIKADLEIRFGIKAHTMVADLRKLDLPTFKESVLSTLGAPHNIFYISGVSDTNDKGPFDDYGGAGND